MKDTLRYLKEFPGRAAYFLYLVIGHALHLLFGRAREKERGALHIAVDAFPLASQIHSGIPRYVFKTVEALATLDRENRYYLYSFSDFDFPAEGNVEKRLLYPVKGKALGGFTWFSTLGTLDMIKNKTDVFWGTRHLLPPLLPRRMRKVLTVHDLVWRYYPETMKRGNLFTTRLLVERSIRAADRIVAVSRATARSLVEVLGVPEDKITVVHNAADGYSPLDKAESAAYISEKYGTNDNYVLTVSTVEPRKNLNLLLKVFHGLRDRGYHLVVAGASGWKTASIHEEYEGLGLTEGEVRFLGYVPEGDMNRLYSGAALFVFPSLYEGFGLPPLEAMASGTAVIASDSSSLPEVVGEAGVLLPPGDEAAWSAEIVRVMGDDSLRGRMRGAGVERAKLFSWERAAREMLEVFRGLG
jgi:glycosyltransferase involved in cell wall biosynthesis